jgi:hypothetical protein
MLYWLGLTALSLLLSTLLSALMLSPFLLFAMH